jgi:NAD+ synthase (glutamine-hydrolysing)
MTLTLAMAPLDFVVGDFAGTFTGASDDAVKAEIPDGMLARYMQDDEGIDEIIAAGCKRAVVERVARLIKINEYKRRHAPVGIRVTHRSFGKDWRYPITSKFNETAGAQKP